MISTIYTPTVFIIAFILFNETINLHSYIGGVLVLGGITISVFQPPKTIKKRDLYIGILFGIMANILTAFSVLIIKPIMKNNSVLYVALYRFSVGFFFGILINLFKSGIKPVVQKFKQGLTNQYVILGAFLGTYLSVIFSLAGYKSTLAGRAAIYNQLSTVFIIILAGLKSIPNEPLEAAKIDGASEWEITRYIRLPMIRSLLFLVLIFRSIDTLKVFDIVWGTTAGGPGLATEALQTYAYRVAYSFLEMSKSMTVMVLFLSLIHI